MANVIKTAPKCVKNQSGAVLLVTMVFMLLTAIISSTLMRSNIIDVKMTGNAQLKEEAFQKSEAIVNAISADQSNFVVAGSIGDRNCAVGSNNNNCDYATINLSNSVASAPNGVSLDYAIVRDGPLLAPLPFRLSEGRASGAGSYNYAFFEVESKYDGRDNRLGHYELFQGVAIKTAVSSQ